MPQTFEQYQLTLLQLQELSSNENPDLFLRQILRQFEHALLPELGYAIDFSVDSSQKEILPHQFYQFQVTEGFAPVVQAGRSSLSGKAILSMLDYEQGQDFSHEQLQLLGKLYRQMITSLLGDRPLKADNCGFKHSNSIVIRIYLWLHCLV